MIEIASVPVSVLVYKMRYNETGVAMIEIIEIVRKLYGHIGHIGKLCQV